MHIRFDEGYGVTGVILGAVCAIIAQGRGRSALVWFLLGFILNCFGLILLLLLPDLKLETANYSRLAEETRRIRERVRLDRRVSDQRHEEARRRLGVHDRALGVDTAPPLPESVGGTLPPPVSREEAPFAHIPWFYAAGGGQQGPVEFPVLCDLWGAGRIDGRTYVWSRGLADWARIEEIPGLSEALGA